MKRLLLLTFFIFLGSSSSMAAGLATTTPSPSPTPPKPNVVVSFERQSLRENDAIQAWIRFSNEWDQGLSNVALKIDAPGFLSWRMGTCGDWQSNLAASTGVVNLGGIAPNDGRSTAVCFKSGSDIMVGDFNVSFTFDYYWPGKTQPHSFVTSEKTLKANLFGTDSVAGVPIALAAFIVPGLFFWLAIKLLRVPWNIGTGLGETVIYSVLISFVLLWLVSYIHPGSSAAISINRLSFFAMVGGITGLTVGIGDHLVRFVVRRVKASRAAVARKAEEGRLALLKADEVKLDDTDTELLRKLLQMYPKYQQPRAVVRQHDVTYEGTLMAETNDVTALIASFRIVQSDIKGSNRAAIIAELAAASNSFERFKIATKHGIKIEPLDSIIKRDANNTEMEMDVAKTFQRKDATAEQFASGGKEPLILD